MTATMLNIADAATTRVLGPGLRAAVWVQGCPFRCQGCMAPQWIPRRRAHLVSTEDLAERLLALPGLRGLTFSGGEPMEQAAGLASLCARVRSRSPGFDVICFTGYRLTRLRRDPPAPGVAELLAQVDVLIDGPYVAALDDGIGLRGSSNQTVHHLTERLLDHADELARAPRSAEVLVRGDDVVITGVPPRHLLHSIRQTLGSPATAPGTQPTDPVARRDAP
ncbi:4Fe-4S single cluster domain-containing protein [Streptomyces iakyrus]|uniref:4Fe-4S single cluster domain-containing protein n=1 Tax=Streptomyces iakyrus TaxID=68219 RepID=UPI0036E3CDAD